MSGRYTALLRELRDRAGERDPRHRVRYVPAMVANQMIASGYAVEVHGPGINPPRGEKALVHASGTRSMVESARKKP